MTNIRTDTRSAPRNPPDTAEKESMMDTNVYPFPRRPRGDTDPPDPETPGDVMQLGKGAVYTVKEVSQYLRISLGGTYALIRSGEIPAKKLGGRWVIPKRRFAAWLDSCVREPGQPTAGPSA